MGSNRQSMLAKERRALSAAALLPGSDRQSMLTKERRALSLSKRLLVADSGAFDKLRHRSNAFSVRRTLSCVQRKFLGVQRRLFGVPEKLYRTQLRLYRTQLRLSCTQLKLSCTQPRLYCTQPRLSCTQLKLSCAQPRLYCTQLRLYCAQPRLSCTQLRLSCAQRRLESDRQSMPTKEQRALSAAVLLPMSKRPLVTGRGAFDRLRHRVHASADFVEHFLKVKIPLGLSCALLLLTVLVFNGCDIQPDKTTGDIVIYNGKTTLNDTTVEIIAERVVQLRALVVLSGETVVWTTSNPNAVTVNETGRIRASKTSGRSAVITAASKENPAVKAEVTFTVVDTR